MADTYDAIVLGAGAAGLFCAAEAGKRGRRVFVVEHADRPGKKILISGGGRCNFTNLHSGPANFLSANPHFAKSALARYTPADFVTLVEQHKIAYHEKTLGQLFCDDSARRIVEMLEAECSRGGVDLLLGSRIEEVSRDTEFRVRAGGRELRAPALVVATGGLSIPKIGATSFGYDLARRFGHRVQPCRPALVPLTFSDEYRSRWSDLAGVSTEVVAAAGTAHFREKMLFTHRGLSGPAVLQASSYWQPGQPLSVDLAPGKQIHCERRDHAGLRNSLREHLPKRLADRWVDIYTPKRWTNDALAEWEERLHRWEFVPAGTEGYDKAEVTAGGVDTDELSAKTMQSRRVPGLFFIGEVVDVTGHLGGHNFQWAWASGWCAGQSL